LDGGGDPAAVGGDVGDSANGEGAAGFGLCSCGAAKGEAEDGGYGRVFEAGVLC
jgi:hypothetical protein